MENNNNNRVYDLDFDVRKGFVIVSSNEAPTHDEKGTRHSREVQQRIADEIAKQPRILLAMNQHESQKEVVEQLGFELIVGKAYYINTGYAGMGMLLPTKYGDVLLVPTDGICVASDKTPDYCAVPKIADIEQDEVKQE
jgi:hypothetical protein